MNPSSTAQRLVAALVATSISATAALLPAAPAGATVASPPITSRIDVTPSGAQIDGNLKVETGVMLDRSGRYAFFSTVQSLTADDTNTTYDVYLRDRTAGTTRLVSLRDDDKATAHGNTRLCGISRDGRFVGFTSQATDLPGNGAGFYQVFLRDRVAGTTSIVSVSSSEQPSSKGASSGITGVEDCPISSTGRYVTFASAGTNLAASEGNTWEDIWRRDRTLGITERMSMTGSDTKADGESRFPSMSDDGSRVAFRSDATNLVPTDTNAKRDIFVRIAASQITVRANVAQDGTQSVGFDADGATISGNGQVVLFTTGDPTLVAGDTGDTQDVFARDLGAGTIEIVSLTTNEQPAMANNWGLSISPDARFVAFNSTSKLLYVGDTNIRADTYIRDRQEGTTQLASRTAGILSGNAESVGRTAVSDDGDTVAFVSYSSDLVRNDTNDSLDVFTHQFHVPVTPFTSFDTFVKQQFADFVGRQPTGSELTEWKARLVNGELTPDNAIDDLAHGQPWAGKRAPLTRLYWAFFLRTPDLGGMDYWTKQLTNGKSLATVAKQFSTSSEFQTAYGSKTNSQFVTLIYQNIFDRDPDAGGLAYWTKKLDTKAKTRGDVMVNFSESSEGKRVLQPQTDVVLIWLGMMRSMPEGTLFTASVANLASGTPPETFAESIRNQAEYAARVSS